jgi:signal transduction histidine kinase
MLKSGNDRRLRRRVIAVFFGAIMLPSLILSSLGLRYIRQEEQRQEQILLRGLQGTLAGIARKTEEDLLDTITQSFESLFAETHIIEGIEPIRIYHYLAVHSLIDQVFVMDQKGQLLFPRSFRDQTGTKDILRELPKVTGQWIIRGEESEAQGNYEEAINYFKSGLNDSKTAKGKLALLIRIARCQVKAGNTDGAIQTYRKVLIEDADRFMGEDVPYQIIATFQLARILDNQGNQKETFDLLFSLYGRMLDGFQRFGQQQYQYYLARVQEELKTHLNDAGSTAPALLDSLLKIEAAFLEEPVQNNFLKSNIVPGVEVEIRLSSEPGKVRYTFIDHAPDSSVLIAFRDLGSQNRGMRIIGARLSVPNMIKSVEESFGTSEIDENLNVVLLKESSSPSQSPLVNEIHIAEEPLDLLEGNMQGFKLALVGVNDITIKDFTARGIRLYYALLVVIIIVIILGVLFIFYDISREQELTRMKSEFISNVTHEIKTPIATIRGLAENVSEGWVTSQEKQQHYFRLIASESEKLGHLVENTLDFSRIESGRKKYFLEYCSVQELIEKTIQRFRILTEGQEIDLSVHMGNNLPSVLLDKAAMEQALLNLLDNALKYSLQEKVIKVNVKEENDHLHISISDRGIGIDRKDRSRIFDKFYRSESGSGKKIAGSGIGLTLVKEIVESHGGNVTFESERNKGSTFIIQLLLNQKSDGKNIIN